jgi:hypothetical protein
LTQPAAVGSGWELQSAISHLKEHGITKLRDMSSRDFLVELLRVGTTLEHALMVQYLYAAYSLGGPQVPEQYRPVVRRWQEDLLTIAREEMGHLLTVQNILTFLGSGVDFGRGSFPWKIEYFSLEPLTKKSLACYIYAEMKDGDEFPEKPEIIRLACEHLGCPEGALFPVGDLYATIISLIGDSQTIPESAFRPDSYLSQASWDDWGRGYEPDPRPLDPEGNLKPVQTTAEQTTPDQTRAIVLISAVVTRTQAVAALKALSVQGEGPSYEGGKEDEPSHFERLMEIFKELTKIENQDWTPSLPVPTDPSTIPGRKGYISADHSRAWADLFNMRYRMLLSSLIHTFRLARVTRSDEPSVRAVMMHRVFGEMYNLKTIALILVQLPLSDGWDPQTPSKDIPRAGPPFEPPSAHTLPLDDVDCWSAHLDTLNHADELCREILKSETRPQGRAYLQALIDVDAQTRARITRILAGLSSTERYSA